MVVVEADVAWERFLDVGDAQLLLCKTIGGLVCLFGKLPGGKELDASAQFAAGEWRTLGRGLSRDLEEIGRALRAIISDGHHRRSYSDLLLNRRLTLPIGTRIGGVAGDLASKSPLLKFMRHIIVLVYEVLIKCRVQLRENIMRCRALIKVFA